MEVLPTGILYRKGGPYASVKSFQWSINILNPIPRVRIEWEESNLGKWVLSNITRNT